jgi:hypothetical protein
MKVVSIVAAGILVGVLVGCATTETRPSAAVTSLVPNVQRWFKVNWTADPERDGERRLRGYVESALGEPANKVQLLALALDASGNVVGHRLEWVPEVIPALGRVYFEIPRMPPATEYRVTVWAYERIKGGGGAGLPALRAASYRPTVVRNVSAFRCSTLSSTSSP